jgi:hypothetical protein
MGGNGGKQLMLSLRVQTVDQQVLRASILSPWLLAAMVSLTSGQAMAAVTATTTKLSIAPARATSPDSVFILTASVKDANRLPVMAGTVNFCLASTARCDGPSLLGAAHLERGSGTLAVGKSNAELTIGLLRRISKRSLQGPPPCRLAAPPLKQ